MVKDMCEKASINGYFTNHSLRATGATALYQARVPETLIKRQTRHWSVDAVRQYECSSLNQMYAVSKILLPAIEHKTYVDNPWMEMEMYFRRARASKEMEVDLWTVLKWSGIIGLLYLVTVPNNCVFPTRSEEYLQYCHSSNPLSPQSRILW